MQEESKTSNDSSLDPKKWVTLNVYMGTDRIKSFETQIQTLKFMPVSAFREKFNIPANIKNQFFFSWNSVFDREISLAEESSAKIFDLLQNYDAFVNA